MTQKELDEMFIGIAKKIDKDTWY